MPAEWRGEYLRLINLGELERFGLVKSGYGMDLAVSISAKHALAGVVYGCFGWRGVGAYGPCREPVMVFSVAGFFVVKLAEADFVDTVVGSFVWGELRLVAWSYIYAETGGV